MARLVTNGFEVGLGASSTAGAGIDGHATSLASATLSSTVKRSGSTALRLTGGGQPNVTVADFAAPSAGTNLYARVYFYATALPTDDTAPTTLMLIGGTSNLGAVVLTSSGKIQMWDYTLNTGNGAQVGSDSTATCSANTWYRIELRQKIGTGAVDEIEVQLDGTQVAVSTGRSMSDSTPTAVKLGFNLTKIAGTDFVYFDDFALNDDVGSVQNSFPGEGKIVILLPNSDSSRAAKWTGGVGGTTNLYDAINNTPPIGTATETDLTQIEHAGGGAGNEDYSFFTETPSNKGVGSSDTLVLTQIVVSTGEDVSTGTKTLTFANATDGSTSFEFNFSAGNDAGALGTWTSGWFVKWGTAQSTSLATYNTNRVVTIRRPGTESRVASVCFAGVYVEYTVPSGTAYTQSLTGSFQMAGSRVSQTNKKVTASFSISGSYSRFTSHGLPGTLTGSGSLPKFTSRAISGSFSSSGVLVVSRLINKVLSGALSMAGTVQKQGQKALSGVFSGSGAHIRGIFHGITGTLTVSGTPIKRSSRSLTGSLSSSGSVAKSDRKAVSGSLSGSGTISRGTSRTHTASLSMAGSAIKRTARALAGTLTSSGSASKTTSRSTTTSLSMSGSNTKRTSRSVAGTLSMSGSLIRKTFRALAAGLQFVGTLTTNYLPGGGGPHAYFQTLTGQLTLNGSVGKGIARTLTGLLTPNGSVGKRIARTLTGLLTFYGWHAGPNEVFWDESGTADEPFVMTSSPHIFVMSDGAQVAIYKKGGIGYQIRKNGVVGEWTLIGLSTGYTSRCARNGDDIYVVTENSNGGGPINAYRLIYSGGSISVFNSRNLSADPSSKIMGLAYDTVNNYIHIHWYDATTGRSDVRAYSPDLNTEHYTTPDLGGLNSGTNCSSNDYQNDMAINGNEIWCLDVDGGTTHGIHLIAGASSYTTATYETGMGALGTAVYGYPTVRWDGTNFIAVGLTQGATSSLNLLTRTGANTFTSSTLLASTNSYSTTDGGAGVGLHRRLSTNDLLIVWTAYQVDEIYGLFRKGGVWDTSQTVLRGTIPIETGGISASIDDTNDPGYAYFTFNYHYPAPFGFGTKHVAVPGTFFQNVAGVLTFAGSVFKSVPKGLTASLSASGSITKQTLKSVAGSLSASAVLNHASTFLVNLAGTLSMSGSLTYRFIIDFIEQQARAFGRLITTSIRNARNLQFRSTTPLFLETKHRVPRTLGILSSQKKISIKVVGPEEMAYKRGTAVLFETTFTDPDTGAVYDPDVGTVKAYLKKPDGTYVTGWDPAVAGQAMTKLSTGIYRVTYQSDRADPTGTWTFESEGKLGTETSLDDAKIQVKA